MKAINEHFEVGQQYYALVSKEVLVVSEVLQPGMYPSGSGGYHTLRSPMVRFRSEKTGLVHTCSLELAKHLLLAKKTIPASLSTLYARMAPRSCWLVWSMIRTKICSRQSSMAIAHRTSQQRLLNTTTLILKIEEDRLCLIGRLEMLR